MNCSYQVSYMDNLFIFPFALLSDSEFKKIFISTLLPFDVNNRIDSHYYHEGDISFTADKSSIVINILHTDMLSISNNLDNFLEAHGYSNVLTL